MTAREVARICDDAPASVFAAGPVTPWQAAHEDYAERVYYNRYQVGSADYRAYEAAWQDAKLEGAHGYYH